MEKLRKKLSEKLVVKSSHPPTSLIAVAPLTTAGPITAPAPPAESVVSAQPVIIKKTPDQVLHACIVKTSLEQTKKCFRCSSVSKTGDVCTARSMMYRNESAENCKNAFEEVAKRWSLDGKFDPKYRSLLFCGRCKYLKYRQTSRGLNVLNRHFATAVIHWTGSSIH